VFSGEQGAHVCSHLVSSKQGRIPEAGVGKMGALLDCGKCSMPRGASATWGWAP
jgi:hypothetical protein